MSRTGVILKEYVEIAAPTRRSEVYPLQRKVGMSNEWNNCIIFGSNQLKT
jgi:hypothetical protein